MIQKLCVISSRLQAEILIITDKLSRISGFVDRLYDEKEAKIGVKPLTTNKGSTQYIQSKIFAEIINILTYKVTLCEAPETGSITD